MAKYINNWILYRNEEFLTCNISFVIFIIQRSVKMMNHFYNIDLLIFFKTSTYFISKHSRKI